MKIKQIEWAERGHSQAVFGGVLHSIDLPLSYYATIRPNHAGFSWSICLRVTTVVDGIEKTVPEAMEACQRAWEGLIMEALEEEDEGQTD